MISRSCETCRINLCRRLLYLMAIVLIGCDCPCDMNRFDANARDNGYDVVLVANISGNQEIFILDLPSCNLNRLTGTLDRDCDPSPSPDGRWIAYTSLRTGIAQIYLTRTDGSETFCPFPSDRFDCKPTWSHDGRKIAYVSYIDQNKEIFIGSPFEPNSSPVRITNTIRREEDPLFSLDDSKILVRSSLWGESYLALLDTFPCEPQIFTPAYGLQHYASWCGDTAVLFTWFVDNDSDVFFKILPNGSLINISHCADAYDYDPEPSPSGEYLAFVSYRDGNRNIYMFSFDGGTISQLTTWENDEYEPKWSPDGNLLLFIRSDGVSKDLCYVDIKSGDYHILTNGLNCEQAKWILK